MAVKKNPNQYLCLAPWTHTYLSPQTERRMCCASTESAQNFTQYIDAEDGNNKYEPLTLDQHWNSDHMKSVRRRMMAGEELPECKVCNKQLLNADVYRNWFNTMFKKYEQDIWYNTDPDGSTTMKPVSFDYRFTNLCNFKCRMCGPMLSSSAETEAKKMNSWDPGSDPWMAPPVRDMISEFQDTQVEKEFSDAVEEKRIEEIYWVGGEPLMYEQHWKYLKRIVELGYPENVMLRYNTNLSRVNYKKQNLWELLSNFPRWNILASLDATGRIGEYIRTGLKYEQFIKNLEDGIKTAKGQHQRIDLDLTITTPGLLDLKNMFDLSVKYKTILYTKVVFTFTNDLILSPITVPKDILHGIIDDVLEYAKPKATWRQQNFINTLEALKTRPTTQEEYHNSFYSGWEKGKERIKKLENFRKDSYTLDNILEEHKGLSAWYQSI